MAEPETHIDADEPTTTMVSPMEATQYPASPPGLELTQDYRKARRQLAMFSGILFAWEFIGVDLSGAKVYDIKLTSPQAAPWMLLALLVYFVYRTTVEWNLCSKESRNGTWPKVDSRVAFGLAAVAFSTFWAQRLGAINVADYLPESQSATLRFVVAAIGPLPIAVLWAVLQRRRQTESALLVARDILLRDWNRGDSPEAASLFSDLRALRRAPSWMPRPRKSRIRLAEEITRLIVHNPDALPSHSGEERIADVLADLLRRRL